jgi:PhzF family phenazine biosynthesis protein
MNSRFQIQSAAVQQKNGNQLPAEIISTGLPDIIYPVASTKELDDLAPDMDALTALSRELNVVGVHAFALSDDGYTAHVRNFAPLYDIPEESATGTANAALTYYLYHNGIIPQESKCTFMQGEAMHRPSVVSTELRNNGSVYVGGNSYILGKGELLV